MDSAVTTIWVCLAEDPMQLHAASPEMSDKLQRVWGEVTVACSFAMTDECTRFRFGAIGLS